MRLLVVGVEAGQEEEDDRNDHQELPGGGVLKPVVQLFPVCQATNGSCNTRKKADAETFYKFGPCFKLT